jgi:hypothetical protein
MCAIPEILFLVIAVLYAPAPDGLPVEVGVFADKEKAVVRPSN